MTDHTSERQTEPVEPVDILDNTDDYTIGLHAAMKSTATRSG